MSPSLRWLLALVAFLILGFLAVHTGLLGGAQKFEDHLAEKARERLAASGVPGAGDVRIEASGQSMRLVGAVPSEEVRDTLVATVRGADWGGNVLLGGVTVVRSELAVANMQSPYTLDARHEGDRIVLSGFVPDDAAREALLQRARTLFPASDIADELRIAQGQPTGVNWPAAASWGLERLARLDAGTLALNDNSMRLTGRSDLNAVIEAVEADFISDGVPANVSAVAELTGGAAPAPAPEPEPEPAPSPAPQPVIENVNECQALFDGLMANNEIRFAFNSADIEPVSVPLLNELAGAARRCESFRIAVEGHTDSTGATDVNQMLSELRAFNVAQYLTGQGIDASRIRSAGFGETQPIASNATREGRARNRRIVFVISE